MQNINNPIKRALALLGMAALVLTLPGCSTTPGRNTPVLRDDMERLPFIARIVNFPSGKQNEGRVIFVVEFNYTDLQFVRSGERYDSGIEYTFSLADAANPEQRRVIDSSQEISVKSFSETVARDGVLRITESFDVPVGPYISNIIVAGKHARNRGVLSHEIEVRDFISSFSITEPLLAWDSVHTFRSDKLIPFKMSNFEKNFFAFVVIGGLDSAQTLSLVYKLQDNRNESLLERSVVVKPQKTSILFSLPIPHEKLSLGTTTLKIIARHREQNIASSLTIRSNFGYRPKRFKNFTVLIGPMRYIMSKKEFEELTNASSEKQTELFNAYWQERNPNAHSESNPLLEEFYYRVEMANARFGWTGGEGYATHRGRIIIKYGPPDSVQNTRRPGSTISYEIWSYYDLGRRFVFIDKYNDGNYRLLSDSGA